MAYAGQTFSTACRGRGRGRGCSGGRAPHSKSTLRGPSRKKKIDVFYVSGPLKILSIFADFRSKQRKFVPRWLFGPKQKRNVKKQKQISKTKSKIQKDKQKAKESRAKQSRAESRAE